MKWMLLLVVGFAISFGLAIKTMDEVFGWAIDRKPCYQWPWDFNWSWHNTQHGCMELWGAEKITFLWILASTIGLVFTTAATYADLKAEV